jgi:vitamin B12 transporter
MSRTLSFAALPFLVLATPALAGESADIVVTATGLPQSRADVGQSITLIDRTRLDTLQSLSIADALRTVPGLSIARSGGLGTATSVFVRGGNSAHTLVLIDGVRINDTSTPNGFFDFGALLTGNVDRVEVLRGPNSVVWGSQAIGGVIDIRNAEPTEHLSVRAGAEYGAHDTAKVTGNVAGKSGILAYSFGGGYIRTDGISALADNIERDGFRNVQANGKLDVALAPGISLDLRGYYNHGKVMTDDKFESLPLSDPRANNEQFVLYAGLDADMLNGRWQNRLSYTRTGIDRTGTDPYTDAFTPISYNIYRAKGKIDRIDYRSAFTLTDHVRLIFGLEHERSDTRNHQPANAPFSSVDTRLVSSVTSEYGQVIIKPLNGLTVTAGARHDDYRLYGEATTLGGNFAWTPDSGATTLRGTYAEGFRAPTMVDTLPPYGNAALRPETSKSYDFGIERKLLNNTLVASATWFHRRSHDLIVLDTTFTPMNIGSARARGIEFSLDLRPSETLSASVTYAFVKAKETTVGSATFVGRQLARRPKHTANVAIDWTSPIGLSLGASIRLAGDSYDSDFGTALLDGYEVADIRASYPVNDRIELYGRIDNLFDADYQTAGGYNSLGRAGYVGIRLKY